MLFKSLEQIFSRVVEDSPDELVIIDSDFVFRSANRAYTKSRGLREKDVVGRRVADVIGESVFRDIRPFLARALAGESCSREGWVDYPAFGRRYLESRYYPFSQDGGKGEKLVLVVLRDRTKEKNTEEALRESEKAYRDLFNSMAEGFALAELVRDENGKPKDLRFLNVNDSFYRLTGLPPGAAPGKTALELIPGADMEWLDLFSEVPLTGEARRFEKYSKRLGGKWLDMHAFPVEGDKFGFCFSDVTEKRNSEEAKAWLASFPIQNPNPVMEVGFDGRIYYINPAATALFPDLKKKGAFHPWLTDLASVAKYFGEEDKRTLLREVKVGDRHFQQALALIAGSRRFRIYGLEITERKKIEETLVFLAQHGPSAPESDFFRRLAGYLAESLGMDYVCIDLIEEGSLSAQTLAVHFDGKFEDNLSYTLKDTPCGEVVKNAVCCFESGVRQLFKNDAVLQEIGAESYLGTTLTSSGGKIIGLIALIGRKPLQNPDLAKKVLDIVGVRASAELERRISDEEIRKSEERERLRLMELEAVLEAVPAAVWIAEDPDCLRITGNRTAAEVLRLSGTANMSKSAPEGERPESFVMLKNGRELSPREMPVQLAASGKTIKDFEFDFLFGDGSVRHMFGNAAPLLDGSGNTRGSVAAFVDITERKRQEEQFKILNRTLKAQSASSHALLHAASEQELLDSICRIIVEVCGHRMVWIGFAENDEGMTVRPAAHAGFDEGYVETLNVSWSEETERGRGPTGTCIRTSKPCVCRDMLADPGFEPWRKIAAERGYASSLSLPLNGSGGAFGALVIYSSQRDPFTDEEVSLLEELAADLSYGIATLRLRAAHAESEKALRESEERFRRMFEGHKAIMLLIEPVSGKIVDANNSAASFYGHSRETLRSMRIHDINRLSPDEVSAEIRRALQEERTFVFPHRVGDDEVRWVEVYSTPFETQGKTLLFSIIHDVTERKRYEIDLIQARNAAADANSAKSDFLARMSHEIRTPMNGIIGMTELSLMEELSPKARGYMELVKHSARSLLEIINDILDFSKIEAGKVELHLEDFNLLEKLGTVFSTLGAIASHKGIALYRTVSHDVPTYIYGDWGRLGQVLSNVVGNAIKFTESGSVSVRVSLDQALPAPPEGRIRLIFEVRDTGVGIPPDKLETIFEAFYQCGGSHHAKFGGTGLGLNISRQLVGLMGGTIRVESNPGIGSTFYFTVEFCESKAPGAVRRDTVTKAKGPKPARLKILLAEDEPVNQMVGRDLLESEGHTVTVVDNGLKALEALAAEEFDLVLMDIQMPVMSGLETTSRIREGTIPGVPKDILIVALTAHAISGDREKFLAARMDDYITKPIDIEEIYRVLNQVSEARNGKG